jgi:hypothetical protein
MHDAQPDSTQEIASSGIVMRPNQQRMRVMAASHPFSAVHLAAGERAAMIELQRHRLSMMVQSNSPREAVPTFSPVSDITSPEYFFVHSKHACVARLTFLKPSLADAEKDQTSVKPNA